MDIQQFVVAKGKQQNFIEIFTPFWARPIVKSVLFSLPIPMPLSPLFLHTPLILLKFLHQTRVHQHLASCPKAHLDKLSSFDLGAPLQHCFIEAETSFFSQLSLLKRRRIIF